jgi:hypothetical protein
LTIWRKRSDIDRKRAPESSRGSTTTSVPPTVDYASDRRGSFAFQAKMFHVKHLCLLFVGKLFALARSSVYAIIVGALFGGGDRRREFSQSVNDALCLCASWCGADFVPPFSETCFGEAE